MHIAHRHDRVAFGWTSGMNLFSLVFALLAALSIIVLLMLIFEAMQRERAPIVPGESPRTVLVDGYAHRS